MFGVVCGPYIPLEVLQAMTVRCTCSALGVPTAASGGHMQTCPMYTPPARTETYTLGWVDPNDHREFLAAVAELRAKASY